MANFDTDHGKLTAAGWAYRTNDRGWLIYHDPETGHWHTGSEAIAILEGKISSRAAA
jgi:hypothetical protein